MCSTALRAQLATQGEQIDALTKKVAKLNVDEAGDVARRFEVMSIPTLILFENGTPKDTLVGGGHSSEALIAWFKKA